jgi:hypothetical protein
LQLAAHLPYVLVNHAALLQTVVEVSVADIVAHVVITPITPIRVSRVTRLISVPALYSWILTIRFGSR